MQPSYRRHKCYSSGQSDNCSYMSYYPIRNQFSTSYSCLQMDPYRQHISDHSHCTPDWLCSCRSREDRHSNRCRSTGTYWECTSDSLYYGRVTCSECAAAGKARCVTRETSTNRNVLTEVQGWWATIKAVSSRGVGQYILSRWTGQATVISVAGTGRTEGVAVNTRTVGTVPILIGSTCRTARARSCHKGSVLTVRTDNVSTWVGAGRTIACRWTWSALPWRLVGIGASRTVGTGNTHSEKQEI